MKVVIYARVSTNGQDYTRQLNDLRNYAAANGHEVVCEFSEKISGAKKTVKTCEFMLLRISLFVMPTFCIMSNFSLSSYPSEICL